MTVSADADDATLGSVLARARALAGGLAASGGHAPTLERLTDSVIRPLATTIGAGGAAAATVSKRSADATLDPAALVGALWPLTLDVTTLSSRAGASNGLKEAAAALQDLSCRLAPADDEHGLTSRIRALSAIQAALPVSIQATSNGPYLLTNVESLSTWLGEPIEVRPRMALCRCGASSIKPFCDGSHARISFKDAKDPARVADRLDRYAGLQVTVLDNRGTCAHSGFCTDGVPTVFRIGQEPFVAPSGARMDDIVGAVRACPSGALSYEVNSHEARSHVDRERPAAVEVSKDGPYRVTGGIPLIDDHGAPEHQNAGASREHYSLCRCGHSQNKPFCSGMHWHVQFKDPVSDPEHTPTLFEWAGGLPALTRMTRIFYSKYVPEDPLIGPLFANMRPDHPERVAGWLGEVFGGPKKYSSQYGGYERMLSQHLGKALTEGQRARWVALLCRSADDAGLPADAEFRAAFVAYLEWGSRLALENSQPGATPPAHMPVPRWWWVCDATPGARISALAKPEEDQQPDVSSPGPDETVTFSQHIKPLFRPVDRRSMSFIFDLWKYDDVVRHARSILERLEQGSMPCDGPWPREKVELFRRWIVGGTPN